jgi:hypothetical protein
MSAPQAVASTVARLRANEMPGRASSMNRTRMGRRAWCVVQTERAAPSARLSTTIRITSAGAMSPSSIRSNTASTRASNAARSQVQIQMATRGIGSLAGKVCFG